MQSNTVGRVSPVDARREAEPDQSLVKQDPGMVPGERSAGAVGTADAGRHADHQQPCVQAAERRNRCVEPVRVT